jgi:hypothetical protein
VLAQACSCCCWIMLRNNTSINGHSRWAQQKL